MVDSFTDSQTRRAVKTRYGTLLRSIPRHGAMQGCWQPDPARDAAELADALQGLIGAADTTTLKQGPRIMVRRGRLFGHDTVVKTYLLDDPVRALTYRWRASRARRAWAAGVVMQEQGLPTPRPLGFLEEYQRGVPVRSHVLMSFVPNALAARWWIEDHCAELGPRGKAAVRREMLAALTGLYARGIYHRDTKATNLLIQEADTATVRRCLWIDLECVQCGRRIRRHDVVRNLVQLRGSLEHCVGRRQQAAFLFGMAKLFPWLRSRAVQARIGRWTRRRLRKEQREGCESAAVL